MDKFLELAQSADRLLAQAEENIQTIQGIMNGMDPEKKLERLARRHRTEEDNLIKLKKTLLEYLVRIIFDLAPHSMVGRYRIESYTEVRPAIEGFWEAASSQPVKCILGSDWPPFHIFCEEAIKRIGKLFEEMPERHNQEAKELFGLCGQLNKLTQSCQPQI